eukprot:TRINITY_DN19673_c0_g1_i1.p1 TRINITY_DN19673_c0_g1~~TRINITY_DN19673_c0_g1_i1.p1  ORF type:complete len:534 (-),score=94.69 TRINITY_DN19673_c0_g1_i1:397-1998(-)
MVCRSVQRTAALLACSLLHHVHGVESSAANAVPVFGDSVETGADLTRLRTVTWNVAAVNNNPFEYWITHPNPAYDALMQKVEEFIETPGKLDRRIDEVFSQEMYESLLGEMEKVGLSNLPTVRQLWEEEYRSLRVVSGFLTNGTFGKKRLASMPDRVTNTIQQKSGGTRYRPTVVNCYAGSWNSMAEWFQQWLQFFFVDEVDVDGKGGKRVYQLLQSIKRSKYPAVTEQEEKASIPLQLLIAAVFDATLAKLMEERGGEIWQTLRSDICASLNSRKSERIMEILQSTYKSADVIFLQEAGNELVEHLKSAYAPSHTLVLPSDYSTKRSQNSLMLLRSSLFSAVKEVVVPGEGWDAGDLLVVEAQVAGLPVTLASFHGDTNGLQTAPMLREVMRVLASERLLFGMDANTYEKVSEQTYHVLEFEKLYNELGLHSCWAAVDPKRYTTFNARTYLQPQLNKAAKSTQLAEKGDRNPKDFMLFTKHFQMQADAVRDNTGRGSYVSNMVFPTLQFPSDHAVVAADIVMQVPRQASAEL